MDTHQLFDEMLQWVATLSPTRPRKTTALATVLPRQLALDTRPHALGLPPRSRPRRVVQATPLAVLTPRGRSHRHTTPGPLRVAQAATPALTYKSWPLSTSHCASLPTRPASVSVERRGRHGHVRWAEIHHRSFPLL